MSTNSFDNLEMNRKMVKRSGPTVQNGGRDGGKVLDVRMVVVKFMDFKYLSYAMLCISIDETCNREID